jgi:ergothioneine biosynthesis protein EgtB
MDLGRATAAIADRGESLDQDQSPGRRLAAQYRDVRRVTHALCEPLESEDYVLQSMPDASPVKWHLAHTSWFFETFVLAACVPNYRPFRHEYSYLFNSYYNAIGERIARPRRGLLSRPTVREVYEYRDAVDFQMTRLLEGGDADRIRAQAPTIVLGLNHEQQHQELILTDIKHAFANNPIRPAYRELKPTDEGDVGAPRWEFYDGGIHELGYAGDGFAFDNELPRHRAYAVPFELASRLVTNSEFRAFVEDGGYRRANLWLSDGWNTRSAQAWDAPLYWERHDDGWRTMTLAGMIPVVDSEPVCHVSFYEADAYARWAGARLPTELEWEVAAQACPIAGNFLDEGRYHPLPVSGDSGAAPAQLFGDVWEWTASPYVPYPKYRPAPGALGEYNGKFMCNQMVLRGGSCATPRSHIRPTYRNFFPPDARWQFAGIRLARDV